MVRHLLLLAQGLTAAATAEALERDQFVPHYRALGVGLRCGRACGPDIRVPRCRRQTGGSPPPLTRRSRRS